MTCMSSKGTPYYGHIEYNDKIDSEDTLPDEDVKAIEEIPVYSTKKPKDESLVIMRARPSKATLASIRRRSHLPVLHLIMDAQ
jgi:hypothetical protein